MKKVLVTIPNEGWTHKHVSFSLEQIRYDKRYSVKIIYPTHRPYENNLHHIILEFLRDKYDYWLNIDSDNPPINNPLDLIELNKDIIGLPTPVWHYTGKENERPIYWNAYKYVSEEDAYTEYPVKDGLQRVDAIGTGCFLISRKVFENTAMQNKPFERKLYSTGCVHKGNDISFCERATKEGFEIFAHYSYPCRHFVELDLVEVSKAIINMTKGVK
jgi:GT2 family glycosyltransferase